MEKLKKIPQNEVGRIANKHKIDASVINGIIDEWEYYDVLHDSFEAFKELPFPKYDELPWSKDPNGWAKLSLFYYANRKEIELPEPKIFKKSSFTFGPLKTDTLELSEFVINHIMKTYLEKMANENLLLDQHRSEEIINFDARLGKRTNDTIIKRDAMIKLAAFYLKSKRIKSYTPIINDLLSKMGLDKVEPGTIRQIIKRS